MGGVEALAPRWDAGELGFQATRNFRQSLLTLCQNPWQTMRKKFNADARAMRHVGTRSEQKTRKSKACGKSHTALLSEMRSLTHLYFSSVGSMKVLWKKYLNINMYII